MTHTDRCLLQFERDPLLIAAPYSTSMDAGCEKDDFPQYRSKLICMGINVGGEYNLDRIQIVEDEVAGVDDKYLPMEMESLLPSLPALTLTNSLKARE